MNSAGASVRPRPRGIEWSPVSLAHRQVSDRCRDRRNDHRMDASFPLLDPNAGGDDLLETEIRVAAGAAKCQLPDIPVVSSLLGPVAAMDRELGTQTLPPLIPSFLKRSSVSAYCRRFLPASASRRTWAVSSLKTRFLELDDLGPFTERRRCVHHRFRRQSRPRPLLDCFGRCNLPRLLLGCFGRYNLPRLLFGCVSRVYVFGGHRFTSPIERINSQSSNDQTQRPGPPRTSLDSIENAIS